MISKSRLEELIEQGAIIYTTKYSYADCGIKLDNKHFAVNEKYLVFTYKVYEILLEELFETQEEAEEYIEFAKVTRTDRLPYIGWNESDCIIFTFYSPIKKDGKQYEFRLFKGGNITIWRTDDMCQVFNKPTTRENYTLAYRKAKKLFLGEKE